MDVECIATGPGHAERSPCSVVIVDYWLNRVLDCVIKPAMPVFSYLTEITGFRQGDLDNGEPLEQVIGKVSEWN
jgi:RNA exonuclease 4